MPVILNSFDCLLVSASTAHFAYTASSLSPTHASLSITELNPAALSDRASVTSFAPCCMDSTRATATTSLGTTSLMAAATLVEADTKITLAPASTAALASSSLATSHTASMPLAAAASARLATVSCPSFATEKTTPLAPVLCTLASSSSSVTPPRDMTGQGPGKLPFAFACSLAMAATTAGSQKMADALFLRRVRLRVMRSESPRDVSELAASNPTVSAPVGFFSALPSLLVPVTTMAAWVRALPTCRPPANLGSWCPPGMTEKAEASCHQAAAMVIANV
mmetsp:Transcript_8998/g.17474  ORF Transcript_8998/g.17474 Transcript_8998/m.17474 type:complete len:280 (+) Transcript_8998:148-987(+)